MTIDDRIEEKVSLDPRIRPCDRDATHTWFDDGVNPVECPYCMDVESGAERIRLLAALADADQYTARLESLLDDVGDSSAEPYGHNVLVRMSQTLWTQVQGYASEKER